MTFSIHPRSIAFRLIMAVLAVELVSSILVVVISFGYERHIHFRSFDVMLRGRADSVLGAVQDADDSGDNVILDKADLHIPAEDVFEVWDGSGHLLGRSSNWQGLGNWPGPDIAQNTGPSPQAQMGGSLAQQPEDFSISVVNGHHYRMLRVQGARTVDPLEPGGGKVHQVVVVYGSPVSHVWRAIRGAVEFYAAGSVLLLLVTGPLIAWLLHRGLLPLRQLASLASQVSVDAWHFSPPASAYSTPELAPLTRALESALHRLERSFLQQRAFVSDAAHELKTAVAVAKSSIQLLTIKRRTPEEYEAGLERCLVDSHRLENLVVEMLTLARAESAAPEASGEPTADLVACMRVAVMKLETISALRDVHVSLIDLAAEASPSQIKVRAAEDDCKMLVSNLLLNALQHSPSASTVDLKLTCEAGEGASSAVSSAVFVVRDRGSGIAPEALPHVFDRFYRGDPSRTRNTGGTGLGLAISKAIVQKAGGSITITSQADPKLPHQGTTVTVRLPMIE